MQSPSIDPQKKDELKTLINQVLDVLGNGDDRDLLAIHANTLTELMKLDQGGVMFVLGAVRESIVARWATLTFMNGLGIPISTPVVLPEPKPDPAPVIDTSSLKPNDDDGDDDDSEDDEGSELVSPGVRSVATQKFHVTLQPNQRAPRKRLSGPARAGKKLEVSESESVFRNVFHRACECGFTDLGPETILLHEGVAFEYQVDPRSCQMFADFMIRAMYGRIPGVYGSKARGRYARDKKARCPNRFGRLFTFRNDGVFNSQDQAMLADGGFTAREELLKMAKSSYLSDEILVRLLNASLGSRGISTKEMFEKAEIDVPNATIIRQISRFFNALDEYNEKYEGFIVKNVRGKLGHNVYEVVKT